MSKKRFCDLDEIDYDLIEGPHQVELLVDKAAYLWRADVLGVDTETTGLFFYKDQVRLIQVSDGNYTLILDLNGFRDSNGVIDWTKRGLADFKELLTSAKTKVLQNAAFDLAFLRASGVLLKGQIFDTYIASKILNNGSNAKNDLGAITKRTIDFELPKELQKSNWGETLSGDQILYAARDAAVLPRLMGPLLDNLSKNRVATTVTLFDVFKLEMQALRPITWMYWYGFGFNREAALALRDKLELEAAQLEIQLLEHIDAAIRQKHPNEPELWLPRTADGNINNRKKSVGRGKAKLQAGFNPASTAQMIKALKAAGIILPPAPITKNGKEGRETLDQNLLAFLRASYPLIAEYLNWKKANTRVSHINILINSVTPKGRIHCNYRQMGTETGRLSAAEPNLQQVPRTSDFRSLFIPMPGYVLVVADFSQIELRTAAELSCEPRMIEAYREGRDLHQETGALLAGVPHDKVSKEQRQSAKIANFGLLYGAGAATLQKQAVAQYEVAMTMSEARSIVKGFREAYPQLYRWQQAQGQSQTPAVFTRYGRRRLMHGFKDKYTTRINTPVQGTVGDIAKIAIAYISAELRKAPAPRARLIAMVHDELVLEVPETQVDHWSRVLQEQMERAGSLLCSQVPIVAEVSWGETWADAK